MRFIVHYAAHRQPDLSDRPQSQTVIVGAKTSDQACEIVRSMRDRGETVGFVFTRYIGDVRHAVPCPPDHLLS